MVFLRLFGGIAIEGQGSALRGRAAQRHPIALLVLLAVAQPRALSRDKLIAYLWPENDARRARNLLNQAVHALRQALGTEAILSTADELCLNPQRVTSDVRQFEEALSGGDREGAVERYSGPFVDGFFLGESVEFGHWVDGERNGLRAAYLRALQELGEAAASAGDPVAASGWLSRLVAEDPHNSGVVLRLMESLEATGDRAGAIRMAESHARLLREDLGAEPTWEVIELAERMRKEPRPIEEIIARKPSPSLDAPAREAPMAMEPTAPMSPPRQRRRRRWVGVAVALLVLGAAGYMGMRAAVSGPSAAPMSRGGFEARGHILIPDFNSPADEWLGRTAGELLRTSFSTSGLLYVPSDAAIRSALARMDHHGQLLELEDARELARREGYELIAMGDIAQLGAGYVLTARLIEPESGEVLGRFRATAASHEDFVRAVDGISTAIRERIGETEESIRRAVPLAQVTTSSLEALKAYTRARHLRLVEGRPDDAVPWFERAIELDSTFGIAYRGLGMTLHWLVRRPDEVGRLFEAAYRHRDRMAPAERVMVDEWAVIERNRKQAGGPGFDEPLIRLHEEFLELHGPHPGSLNNLAHHYWQGGRLEEAIRTWELRLAIEYRTPTGLILARIETGDMEGAERDLAGMRDREGQTLDWYLGLAGIALARGKMEASYGILEEAAARHSDQPRGIALTLGQRAMIDAVLGRLERAERHMRELILRVESAGESFHALIATMDLATMLVLVNPAEAPRALRLLDTTVRQNPPPPPHPSGHAMAHWKLASAYGLLGEPRRGREFLEQAFRHEPGFAREWDSVLGRAAILRAEDRHEETVRVVMDAIRRNPEHPDRQLLGLLADAYLELGKPDSAMVAYEFLLSDRAIGPPYLHPRAFWALALPRAHRELGRLHEERGDTARAIEHLASFIELWRDADPALQPQVQDAARRLVSLRHTGESQD